MKICTAESAGGPDDTKASHSDRPLNMPHAAEHSYMQKLCERHASVRMLGLLKSPCRHCLSVHVLLCRAFCFKLRETTGHSCLGCWSSDIAFMCMHRKKAISRAGAIPALAGVLAGRCAEGSMHAAQTLLHMAKLPDLKVSS